MEVHIRPHTLLSPYLYLFLDRGGTAGQDPGTPAVAVDLGVPLPVPPRPDRDTPGQSQRLRLGVLSLTHPHRFRNCMATAASQPYIAKLGFSDPDRSKDRHGLACEYLFERLLELEVAPLLFRYRLHDLKDLVTSSTETRNTAQQTLDSYNSLINSYPDKRNDEFWVANMKAKALNLEKAQQALCVAQSNIEQLSDTYGIKRAYENHKPAHCLNVPIKSGYSTAGFADVFVSNGLSYSLLGEVKITKQSAETVLQQINYYSQHIREGVSNVYILTDYDCSDLQRLTQ